MGTAQTMALSRRIARPLLASIFVAGGVDAVRHPASKVKKAESVTGPLAERLEFLPSDPERLVQINGAVQIGAGLLLATGRFRRVASLALIASIIPTTYAGHRFWEEADEEARSQQMMQLFKNLGLLGGLILAAVDTEGEPSLSWRAKRRARRIETALAVGRAANGARARGAAQAVQAKAVRSSRSGRRTLRHSEETGRRATQKAKEAGADAALQAATAGVAAAKALEGLGIEGLRQASGMIADVVRESGVDSATPQRALAAVERSARQLEPLAHSAVNAGRERVGPVLSAGGQRATDLLDRVEERLPAH